ncbi:unnamed protein product [Leptosia nina]|uniref:C2H2-type domain-containing protein n=1 Tax=Leptosia nina TaxID=320188 RepID=A0AAV1K0U6_9NEOP
MSLPPLRRLKKSNMTKISVFPLAHLDQHMILTLKSGKKLVVSSDSFHCVLTISNTFKCLICEAEFKCYSSKEKHKTTELHKKRLALKPNLEEFPEDLIRQLDAETCYCSICNVVIPTHSLMRHLSGEGHSTELNKAKKRSFNYKPLQ